MSTQKEITFIVDNNGCHICTSHVKTSMGYVKVKRSLRGKKFYSAHRYIFSLENGDIPDGLLVCHKCDVRTCINPDHLFLGTHKDNTKDMIDKGRYCGSPEKLSKEQHIEIKLSTGCMSQMKLSKLYNVSRSHISYSNGKKDGVISYVTDFNDRRF
jgi:hypothetical protein